MPTDEDRRLQADIEARSGQLPGSGTAEELRQAAVRRHIEAQGGVMADGPPCDVPPPGWACSRGKGHDGPCAPYPVLDNPENGSTEWDNLVNPHAFKMVREAEQTGEPLFCFRARDFFSIQIIAHYAEIVERYGPDDADFHRNIVDALNEFKAWQRMHMSEVRYPD